MKLLLYSFSLLFMVSCSSHKTLNTVDYLDLNQYQGKWYELARLPNRFEKNLDCVTAEYALLPSGKVQVVNKGFDISSGLPQRIEGVASPVSEWQVSKLKVQFVWPFKGDYYVIDLDPEYQYALVGAPNREYLWILSKSKYLEEEIYQSLIAKAKHEGFDVSKLEKVNQDCNSRTIAFK